VERRTQQVIDRFGPPPPYVPPPSTLVRRAVTGLRTVESPAPVGDQPGGGETPPPPYPEDEAEEEFHPAPGSPLRTDDAAPIIASEPGPSGSATGIVRRAIGSAIPRLGRGATSSRAGQSNQVNFLSHNCRILKVVFKLNEKMKKKYLLSFTDNLFIIPELA